MNRIWCGYLCLLLEKLDAPEYPVAPGLIVFFSAGLLNPLANAKDMKDFLYEKSSKRRKTVRIGF
jgi:hypothetical protein